KRVALINQYRQFGDIDKLEGIVAKLLEPIRQFLQSVSSVMSSPLTGEEIPIKDQTEAQVNKRMDFEDNTEHFDEEKQGLGD
ncbi:MAG: hypothetical protein RR315_08330, partial [Oscillospiraceae bacterium]